MSESGQTWRTETFSFPKAILNTELNFFQRETERYSRETA